MSVASVCATLIIKSVGLRNIRGSSMATLSVHYKPRPPALFQVHPNIKQAAMEIDARSLMLEMMTIAAVVCVLARVQQVARYYNHPKTVMF